MPRLGVIPLALALVACHGRRGGGQAAGAADAAVARAAAADAAPLHAAVIEPLPEVVAPASLDAGEGRQFTLLAPARGLPRGVDVGADGEVAWATYGGAVFELPGGGGGGEAQLVWHGARGISAFAADDQALYWCGFDDGTIRRVARGGGAGGEVLTLASGEGRPVALAVADGTVYFVREDDGGLWAVAASGGGAGARRIAARPGHGRTLAVSGDDAYWMVAGPAGAALYRVDRDGGPVRVVADQLGEPDGLAVDAGAVYWLDEDPDDPMPARRGRLWRRARDGADDAAPELLAGRLFSPTELVLADGFAWFVTGDGAVVRVAASAPAGDGAVETVAGGTRQVGAIAVHGGRLYVASGGTHVAEWKDAAILRLDVSRKH